MSFYLSRCASPVKWCQIGFIRSCSTRYTKDADNSTRYTRDEEGPKKKIIHGQEYPQWKIPVSDTPGEFQSKFRVFATDKIGRDDKQFIKLMTYPVPQWPSIFKKWFDEKYEQIEISFQEFSTDRLEVLGFDLAAAHFVVFRGGGVKFQEQEEWIRMDRVTKTEPKIPKMFVPGLFLEMIDCENFERGGLRYEGLLNIQGLEFLKWLSLKGNIHIDDWCLDRLSHLTSSSLEYLDLRGCSVTYRGLNAFYRMEKLKLLILDSKSEIPELELACGMLQEMMPDLLIKLD